MPKRSKNEKIKESNKEYLAEYEIRRRKKEGKQDILIFPLIQAFIKSNTIIHIIWALSKKKKWKKIQIF